MTAPKGPTEHHVYLHLVGFEKLPLQLFGLADRCLALLEHLEGGALQLFKWQTEKAKLDCCEREEQMRYEKRLRYDELRQQGKLLDVWLLRTGPHKIQVIKAIRGLTNLGLKEAKHITDMAPCVLRANVDPDDAEVYVNAIEEAGGVVEVRPA